MKIFLQKQIIKEEHFIEARKCFNEKYLEKLWEKANLKENLVSRFIISKLFEEKFWVKNYEPKINEFWKPIFENNLFWSISHKSNLVFVWISDFKIWLDIEIIKIRDENLLYIFDLENYSLLWWKSWKNFYILWTIKESIIKYNLVNFDEIKDFKLIKVEKKVNIINNIYFELELLVSCNFWKYIILSWKEWENIFSLCV